MKKTLLTVLILLLIALLAYTVLKGWSIGSIDVLSYTGIQEKNEQLDKEIEKAATLKGVNYQKELNQIDENMEQLKSVKEEYNNLTVSVGDSAKPATQLERYEMEYLWTQIGNHAKAEGVTLSIDVEKSFDPTQVEETEEKTPEPSPSQKPSETLANVFDVDAATITSTSTGADSNSDETYDLAFTVSGGYVPIADFIYAIENDSTLGFKIENFHMGSSYNSAETGICVAKFECKDIRIKKVTETSAEQKNEDNDETKNTTNSTNKTNSVNTNKTNTTKKNNTTN